MTQEPGYTNVREDGAAESIASGLQLVADASRAQFNELAPGERQAMLTRATVAMSQQIAQLRDYMLGFLAGAGMNLGEKFTVERVEDPDPGVYTFAVNCDGNYIGTLTVNGTGLPGKTGEPVTMGVSVHLSAATVKQIDDGQIFLRQDKPATTETEGDRGGN